MKEDIVRRERAQAAIIDNQAKRLEELDALYKVGCHDLRCALLCCCIACSDLDVCWQCLHYSNSTHTSVQTSLRKYKVAQGCWLK